MGIHHDLSRMLQRKFSSYKKWIKSKFKEIASKEATPHEVAFGFSLGVFVGLATPGFDILVGLLILMLFRMHKLAMLIGLAIINPITTAFIYPVSFKIGSLIIGYKPIDTTQIFTLQNLLNVSMPLLLGNLIMAAILSIFFYFIIFQIYYVTHYKHVEERALAMKMFDQNKR